MVYYVSTHPAGRSDFCINKEQHMQDLNIKQLALSVRQIAEEKNLPEESVHDIIEQAIAAAYRRDFGDREQEVRAGLNTSSGKVKVYISKEVVDEVFDETFEIS